MPNLGAGEIIVIMLVALIVLGPQRLPDAARQVGKAFTELKRVSTGFQNEFRSTMDEVTMADEDLSLNAQKRLTQRDDPPAIATAAEEVSRQGTPSAKRTRPRRTAPLRAAPDPGDGVAEETTDS
jgi:Tat protein translocase TatB subunit